LLPAASGVRVDGTRAAGPKAAGGTAIAAVRAERQDAPDAEEESMDALINKVAERTGISQDKARTAVDTVVGFLKERAPAGLSGQIDSLVSGGEGSGAGNIASKVGGMFGGEKQQQ
jgi:hypothetical protein